MILTSNVPDRPEEIGKLTRVGTDGVRVAHTPTPPGTVLDAIEAEGLETQVDEEAKR